MKVIVTGIGRCGTKTMFEFFKYQGWTAYHCRYEVRAAMLAQRIYIDSSWGATGNAKAFAELVYKGMVETGSENICESEDKYFGIIEELYKLDNDIKFIILNRDEPGFLKSGLFRKWYQTSSLYDEYRLDPGKQITAPADKIKWLRNTVNDVILKQLSNVPVFNWAQFKLEEFSTVDMEKEISTFLNMEKENSTVSKVKFKKGFDWNLRHNANPYPELVKKDE